MTISPPDVLTGVQRPRLLNVPLDVVSTAGQEAADLAASAGLYLDDWQRFVLDVALSEGSDGKWSAFEVALIVGRQNGKGSVLEARALAGLFLFDEALILHSAHEFKTAHEAFRRIRSLIENTPDLARKVKRWRDSNEVSVELTTGQRLMFVARSGGSGRGFSGDCVILDEAYNLGAKAMGALLPTLSARPNPQVWYTSSAPMETSEQLHRVRRRGIAGDEPRLAYLEWSIDDETDDQDDPLSWARANPGFGIRISQQFVADEKRALDEHEFARERLGVPDPELGAVPSVISPEQWAACEDQGSQIDGPLVLVVDMPPDRSQVTLSVGGRRADGLTHVEVIEQRKGTRWLRDEVVRLLGAHEVRHVLLAPGGPAGGVLPDVEDACRAARPGDDEVLRLVSTGEFTQACGRFFDLVTAETPGLRHLGQGTLDGAVAAGVRKLSGDAWRWARQSTDVDISPLCGCSVAAWAVDALPEQVAVPVEPFVVFR